MMNDSNTFFTDTIHFQSSSTQPASKLFSLKSIQLIVPLIYNLMMNYELLVHQQQTSLCRSLDESKREQMALHPEGQGTVITFILYLSDTDRLTWKIIKSYKFSN